MLRLVELLGLKIAATRQNAGIGPLKPVLLPDAPSRLSLTPGSLA
jgi:hypothetical protein